MGDTKKALVSLSLETVVCASLIPSGSASFSVRTLVENFLGV